MGRFTADRTGRKHISQRFPYSGCSRKGYRKSWFLFERCVMADQFHRMDSGKLSPNMLGANLHYGYSYTTPTRPSLSEDWPDWEVRSACHPTIAYRAGDNHRCGGANSDLSPSPLTLLDINAVSTLISTEIISGMEAGRLGSQRTRK
jgi:hypothetical protein